MVSCEYIYAFLFVKSFFRVLIFKWSNLHTWICNTAMWTWKGRMLRGWFLLTLRQVWRQSSAAKKLYTTHNGKRSKYFDEQTLSKVHFHSRMLLAKSTDRRSYIKMYGQLQTVKLTSSNKDDVSYRTSTYRVS